MPPKWAKSPFAGGWSAEKAAKLEKIPIPEKIKCMSCKRVRVNSAYSKKQLRDLRDIIYSNAKVNCTTGAYIRCRQCTGQQVNEMTCCVCDEVKGLTGFSKAQRRDPDRARCIQCVNLHIEAEGDEDSYSDTSNPYEDDASSIGENYDDPEGVAQNDLDLIDQLSITQQNADTTSTTHWSENWKATATTSHGGVMLPRDESEYEYRMGAWKDRSEQRNKENTTAGIPFTGYDAQGKAHARMRVPSTAATSDVLIDLGPPESVRANAFPPSKGKFAKIHAAKPRKKRQVYPSSEEDDSENGGAARSAIGKTKKKALPAENSDGDEDDDYMKEI